MTEKKEVKSAPKAAAKKATTRKSASKATAIAINEVNVGYRRSLFGYWLAFKGRKS